jgi:hypothetical protein
MRYLTLASIILLATAPDFALAQTSPSTKPPATAMKLSDLVAKVEKRDKFLFISEIQWSEQGYYEVTYFMNDKAKVDIKLDPVSGELK